jgi:hypothetical protein
MRLMSKPELAPTSGKARLWRLAPWILIGVGACAVVIVMIQ